MSKTFQNISHHHKSVKTKLVQRLKRKAHKLFYLSPYNTSSICKNHFVNLNPNNFEIFWNQSGILDDILRPKAVLRG